ncbi:MAG TPA: outer membrane lipoprotein-sorting protein [Spirochaetota bacterium]|nr:outer membrane lipoprotein-sorting protein [Spirochaetota bacterium]HPP04769.1 outer membrane lipoprotein-sorting protein [Spirochaetota bacterium]
MKKRFIFLFLIVNLLIFSQDANTILKNIDNNQVYDSIKYEGEMIIYISGKKYVKTFKTLARGNKEFFTEFTNQDDLGTKYLKIEGTLYVYSEDLEDVMQITGHMLKESVMGSDLSYEDMTENNTLSAQYNAKIVEEITYDGKNVWVLELTAKTKNVSYPKRKLWVEKDIYLPLKEELYSLSGAALKENKIIKYEKIKGKNFPVQIETRDLLRKNSKTEFIMKNIDLDVKIPDSVFSLKNLKK